MEKLRFLRELSKHGVEYLISYPAPGGSSTFVISPEELVKFSENPEAAIAKHCGVTVREYLLWQEEGYSVQCSSTTQKGKRCRNIVTGGSMVTPAKWVKLTGQYCDIHEHGSNKT